jgi:ATP-dependent Clp protease ATP-binding subunit ClpC
MTTIDRFTPSAQDAAARAAEIMQRYGHDQVDTEHLLLALLEQPEGEVPATLGKLEADVGPMASKLDGILKAYPRANVHGDAVKTNPDMVFITPRVKQVLDLANEEAKGLQDERISAEHLFLAIADERDTPAARLLTETGVSRERVYDTMKDSRSGQR